MGLWSRTTGRTAAVALFHAVDGALTQGAPLAPLLDLARAAPPYAAQVWRALALGPGDQARAALGRIADDAGFDGYARRGARAWALFLDLPRLVPVPDGPLPPLFQFWDRDPPADVAAEIGVWRGLAPDHTLYDDAGAEEYIRAVAGGDAAAIYRRCPHPAIKSDLFRLCRLQAQGGVYVDADARARPGADQALRGLGGVTLLWARTREPALSFANGLIAAPPGAPLVAAARDMALARLADPGRTHVFDLAGPGLWTDAALALAARGALGPVAVVTDGWVSARLLTQIDAGYKRDARNWRLWQAGRDG